MPVSKVRTVRPAFAPNVLIVEITDDDGLTGLGEAFFGAAAVEAYLHETAVPVLMGLDDVNPEMVSGVLRNHVGFQGSGVETRGNGAIDLALWDLLGRRAGLPVHTLLGGPVERRIPAYNTCAGPAYVKDESRQSVANWGVNAAAGAGVRQSAAYEDLEGFMNRPGELAKDLWADGFRIMKVWPFDIGAERTRGVRLDADTLQFGLGVLDAIRSAVPDMGIMVELHGLWNLPSAIRLVRELERFQPVWVEDPMRSDDVDAYAQLRAGTSCPIATGETLTGQRSFRALFDRRAVDIPIVDLGWVGGLTVARKVASLADSYDLPFAPHDCTGPIQFAACVHLAASQPNCYIQESVRAFRHTWYGQIVHGVPDVVDGHAEASLLPGLGVELVDGFDRRSDVAVREIVR